MSKITTKHLQCPSCFESSEQTVWHSINTSVDDAANQILNHQINYAVCPGCQYKYHIPVALLFNNMQKQYAVYYNPRDFQTIDNECEGLKKLFGGDFYLANPKKFHDWELFKNEIKTLENASPGIKLHLASKTIRQSQPADAQQGLTRKQKIVATSVAVFVWLVLSAVIQAGSGPGGRNPGGVGLLLMICLIVTLVAIWRNVSRNTD